MSRRMLKKTERRCRLEPIGSGCDGNGDKHPLGLVEGATENTTVVQALIDNLIERGLDPKVCRLFIIDGAKALSKSFAAPSAPTPRSSAAKSIRRAT
jgi:hypothetical protein